MACVKQKVMLAEGYDQFSFEIYESLLVGFLRLPFAMCFTEYVKGSPRPPYLKLVAAVLIFQKLSSL